MVSTEASTYAISSPNLVLTPTINTQSAKNAIVGSTTYYFYGTTDDASATKSQFDFTLVYNDPCRSSSITS